MLALEKKIEVEKKLPSDKDGRMMAELSAEYKGAKIIFDYYDSLREKNRERARVFRENHPGYYDKYHSKKSK